MPLPACSILHSQQQQPQQSSTVLALMAAADDDATKDDNNHNKQTEADRLQQQAERMRQEIRDMEAALGESRQQRQPQQQQPDKEENADSTSSSTLPSLDGKRVLVTGANGRLGSMVCRYLLRNHPQTQVVAVVHVVGEASTRGYGRLSYEVGAEDGVGQLGPIWSAEDNGRRATFTWQESMAGYNLQNLRVVECELLDPVSCQSVVDDAGCNAVIWCATDFHGNQPRAISGLNLAFLFRAVTVPDKGRVEVEGLENMLGALYRYQQEQVQQQRRQQMTVGGSSSTTTVNQNNHKKTGPLQVVLVSTDPNALEDFETPFGSFVGIKRRGEELLLQDFPSLESVVLQMGRYEDNFVQEDLPICMDLMDDGESLDDKDKDKQNKRPLLRMINRRDAARAAVNALTNRDLVGKIVPTWTAER